MTVFENVKQVKRTDGKEREWRVENRTPERFAEELIEEGFGAMMAAEAEAYEGAGRPRVYPDAMVIWGMKIMYAWKTGYRQTVGIMRAVLKRARIRCISTSQFYHRAKSISSGRTCGVAGDARILAKGIAPVRPAAGRKITVAVDSTGVRPSRAGEWLAKRYDKKKQRGWFKLHAATDADTNEILAFVITAEDCGDNTCFMMLIDMVWKQGMR